MCNCITQTFREVCVLYEFPYLNQVKEGAGAWGKCVGACVTWERRGRVRLCHQKGWVGNQFKWEEKQKGEGWMTHWHRKLEQREKDGVSLLWSRSSMIRAIHLSVSLSFSPPPPSLLQSPTCSDVQNSKHILSDWFIERLPQVKWFPSLPAAVQAQNKTEAAVSQTWNPTWAAVRLWSDFILKDEGQTKHPSSPSAN